MSLNFDNIEFLLGQMRAQTLLFLYKNRGGDNLVQRAKSDADSIKIMMFALENQLDSNEHQRSRNRASVNLKCKLRVSHFFPSPSLSSRFSQTGRHSCGDASRASEKRRNQHIICGRDEKLEPDSVSQQLRGDAIKLICVHF